MKTNQYSDVCKKCNTLVDMGRGIVYLGKVYCFKCDPTPIPATTKKSQYTRRR